LVLESRGEAGPLGGDPPPAAGAKALLAAGAQLALVSLGPDGALLRGAVASDVPGVPAQVLSTVGAGDCLTGVLVARLTASGYDPAAVAAALPEAVVEAARACERWGAV
jgi:sugar/nucleoside kinase (ribokinase family)